MLGSANLEGGSLFHVMSGNLSHQIEHHLYPDLPAHRYKAIAPEVQALCERFGLPYNTGRLSKQFGSVVAKIVGLALPGRKAPQRKRRHPNRTWRSIKSAKHLCRGFRELARSEDSNPQPSDP